MNAYACQISFYYYSFCYIYITVLVLLIVICTDTAMIAPRCESAVCRTFATLHVFDRGREKYNEKNCWCSFLRWQNGERNTFYRVTVVNKLDEQFQKGKDIYCNLY